MAIGEGAIKPVTHAIASDALFQHVGADFIFLAVAVNILNSLKTLHVELVCLKAASHNNGYLRQ